MKKYFSFSFSFVLSLSFLFISLDAYADATPGKVKSEIAVIEPSPSSCFLFDYSFDEVKTEFDDGPCKVVDSDFVYTSQMTVVGWIRSIDVGHGVLKSIMHPAISTDIKHTDLVYCQKELIHIDPGSCI